MDPGLSAAAARIFADVLGEFAFLFGDPVPASELPPLSGKGYLASLPFHGEVQGRVSFVVPEGLALEIAANTLGIERTEPEASRRAQDAIKEVASVLGGHLAGAMGRPSQAVELSPPELSGLENSEWERLRFDPATQCFAVNEYPAMLRVEILPEGRST
ncbi:MAG TPA: chemotaxis protein CheX [Planctomycetota bacterium]|jgi:chemotaxis protein CheY-P-specific phosphatase CheC|nr:chemotaxis protein CheX [Planctomycetota bacterium]